jgi:hypothetical protein
MNSSSFQRGDPDEFLKIAQNVAQSIFVKINTQI